MFDACDGRPLTAYFFRQHLILELEVLILCIGIKFRHSSRDLPGDPKNPKLKPGMANRYGPVLRAPFSNFSNACERRRFYVICDEWERKCYSLAIYVCARPRRRCGWRGWSQRMSTSSSSPLAPPIVLAIHPAADQVAHLGPDVVPVPGTSTFVQEKLGIPEVATMDVRSACCGAFQALTAARQFCLTGTYKTVLICACDVVPSVCGLFISLDSTQWIF